MKTTGPKPAKLSRGQKRAIKKNVQKKVAEAAKQAVGNFSGVSAMPKGTITKTKIATGDARLAKNDSRSVELTTVQPAVTIEVALSRDALYGVVQQYLSFALSRGYMAYARSPDWPYFSAVYLINVLLAYVRGTTPTATSLPYWVQCFGQALAPKIAKFENGWVQYRFIAQTTGTQYVPAPNYPTGAPAFGYEWLLFVQGTGDVDLFPKATAPSAYSDSDGYTAWSSLAQFMTVAGNKMTQVLPICETTWKKNVSAFGVPQIIEGYGVGAGGGMAFSVGLEVPVHNPILAVFASADTTGDGVSPLRYPKFSGSFAGDAMFAGAAFSQLMDFRHLNQKRMPRVHYVDFLEFADVLAIYASKLLTAKFNDTTAQTSIQTPSTYQCPLTLQETMLVLRNEIMTLFNRSQVAFQANYPRVPANGSANEFQPYLCSSNTVSLGYTGMKLPLPFVENMKSLMYRMMCFHQNKDPLVFTPVLGQFNTDELISTDYTATLGGDTPVTINTFATLSSHLTRRRRASKGESNVWSPQVEAPISLIDGTSGSDYVFINDTTRLKTLTALWNDWISPLSAYSSPLTVVSGDIGVNICCSISSTRHWIPESQGYKDRVVEVRDARVENTVGLRASPYVGRQAIAVSCHEKVLSAPFSEILSMWILPQNMSVSSALNTSKTFFSRVQIIYGEPFSVSTSNLASGVTMASLHTSYASKMVRGPTAPLSSLDQFFVDQAKNGTGGILSGLVADFVGKTFGPSVGGIAKSVAEIIPI
jgi:hypothetical protein